jgi:rubrerythrin
MFDIGILFSTFAVVFFAEIGDKTQLVAFSLTSSTRRPIAVFLASSSALVLSTVIAAFLGGAALRVIPGFTQYIASALFIVFGLYILISREMPKIKEGFLQAVLLENAINRYLPGISAGKGKQSRAVAELVSQERSHAETFRFLIKEKKLFKDDINEDPRLDGIIDKLKYPKNLRRLPSEESLRRILEMEDASIEFFRFLHEHLEAEHHDEAALQETLALLVEEEHHHKAIIESLKEQEES